MASLCRTAGILPSERVIQCFSRGAQVIGSDGFNCGRKALDRVFAEGQTQACLRFTAWQVII